MSLATGTSLKRFQSATGQRRTGFDPPLHPNFPPANRKRPSEAQATLERSPLSALPFVDGLGHLFERRAGEHLDGGRIGKSHRDARAVRREARRKRLLSAFGRGLLEPWQSCLLHRIQPHRTVITRRHQAPAIGAKVDAVGVVPILYIPSDLPAEAASNSRMPLPVLPRLAVSMLAIGREGEVKESHSEGH